MKLLKLPKGWQWSYVFPSFEEWNGKMSKPCACAVRSHMKLNKEGIEIFDEVFERAETEKEAMKKAIGYIKTHKRFKSRPIRFPEEE